MFQGVTSTTQSEDDEDPLGEPDMVTKPQPASTDDPELIEPARLAVNLEAWNNFLEQSYPHQQPEHLPEENDTPLQLKDSGIDRPSFCATSVDILGTKTIYFPPLALKC